MTPWETYTVVMLKNELRSRGLKVSGRKAELVQRLRDFEQGRFVAPYGGGSSRRQSRKRPQNPVLYTLQAEQNIFIKFCLWLISLLKTCTQALHRAIDTACLWFSHYISRPMARFTSKMLKGISRFANFVSGRTNTVVRRLSSSPTLQFAKTATTKLIGRMGALKRSLGAFYWDKIVLQAFFLFRFVLRGCQVTARMLKNRSLVLFRDATTLLKTPWHWTKDLCRTIENTLLLPAARRAKRTAKYLWADVLVASVKSVTYAADFSHLGQNARECAIKATKAFARWLYKCCTCPSSLVRSVWTSILRHVAHLRQVQWRYATAVTRFVGVPVWNALEIDASRGKANLELLVNAVQNGARFCKKIARYVHKGTKSLWHNAVASPSKAAWRLCYRKGLYPLWKNITIPLSKAVYRFAYNRGIHPLHMATKKVTLLIIRFIRKVFRKKGITLQDFTLGVTPGRLMENPTVTDPLGGEINGYVVLKDGQQFSVYMRNNAGVFGYCKLTIDGNVVGEFRLAPRKDYYLQRPIGRTQRFTFVVDNTHTSSSASGPRCNGIVDALFIPEQALHSRRVPARRREQAKRRLARRARALLQGNGTPAPPAGEASLVPTAPPPTGDSSSLRHRNTTADVKPDLEEFWSKQLNHATREERQLIRRERREALRRQRLLSSGLSSSQHTENQYHPEEEKEEDYEDANESGEEESVFDVSSFREGMTQYSGTSDQQFSLTTGQPLNEPLAVGLRLKLVAK